MSCSALDSWAAKGRWFMRVKQARRVKRSEKSSWGGGAGGVQRRKAAAVAAVRKS